MCFWNRFVADLNNKINVLKIINLGCIATFFEDD
jgi:hypothetical protein